MTIAPRLKQAVSKIHRPFKAGRSPQTWHQQFNQHIQQLKPLRQACDWVIQKTTTPQLQTQPLLGSCLTDLLTGWETERSQPVAPKRIERPTPLTSPAPSATSPVNRRSTPKPVLPKATPSTNATLTKTSQRQPLCDLPTQATPSLLKTLTQEAQNKTCPPLEPSTSPQKRNETRPHPWLKKEPPKRKFPEATPSPPADKEPRFPKLPCSEQDAKPWLAQVEQRAQAPLFKASPLPPQPRKTAQENPEKHSLTAHLKPSQPNSDQPPAKIENARSRLLPGGQQVSRTYLTWLLDNPTTAPTTASGPSRSAPDSRPPQVPASKPAQFSKTDLPADPKTRSPWNFDSPTPAQNGHQREPVLAPPTQFNPDAPTTANSSDDTSRSHSHQNNQHPTPQPAQPHPFLEPTATSLPSPALPNLLSPSLTSPSPVTLSDTRANECKPPPNPEDLNLLSDKIQQILTAEARRHGINL
ncbi:hypothetical protein PN498_14045 [Oscillatoria sp. CS-180]|uniref:hypothetical protein n=1 Tax=Oscillatoria sp. CS-180 TaxID=3021720 RepID=UPI00232F0D5F|nr:hypothetical protein [Oscillatoria sp. CS-180]MDB9527119.1 hypothetical protein [Oscillatoria sp. CS-180]